jgi:hypothetical protein
MAVVLKYDSSLTAGASTADGSIDRKYVVGSTSDNDAYSELLAHADCPESISTPFGVLFRKRVSVTHVGGGNYECEANWAGLGVENDEPTFVELSFSTQGKTEHITQSLNTTRYPGTADDHGGQVGVTKDGVEGVDITIPGLTWTETHIFPNADCDNAYLIALKALTGTVNDATFRGHSAGEVLFLGANGSRKNAEQWQIEFSFVAIPNASSLTVGTITGIDKKGHEYMWITWDKEESGGEFVKSVPRAVYVEQVYPTSDFSGLNIGTGAVI